MERSCSRSTYRLHENVFYQHRQGFLEAGALATTSRMIGINIQRTANRTFWEASKQQFNADFVRWVDEIVGRGDP